MGAGYGAYPSFGRPAFVNNPMPMSMSAAPMMNSIYGSMPAVPSMYASAVAAPQVAVQSPAAQRQSIYSSMMNMPSSSSLYSSQAIAPSIYASMPSAPVSAAPRAAAPKDEIPSLQEGFSTVGLMLWPGKGGELLVTGFMEGHSAENCGLETGDIIIRVDDTAVEGMAASTAAECMAGPTGSSVTVTTSRSTKTTNADGSASTTKTTHSAVITRDVSSDEANKKTNESFKSTGMGQTRPMSHQECMQYGVPFGSTWGASGGSGAAKPKSPAAYKTPFAAPVMSEGRLLTQQECMMFRVPYGSRMSAPKPKELAQDMSDKLSV